MLRQELVEEERWISNEHFNRVFAVYRAQVSQSGCGFESGGNA